ncbi:MAG TPA: hypothetical protein P5280_03080 [Cyclobacteriaceae bacterium]|nr:hypothetical protein [Cyclobacteriaceae bacterium]
MGKGTALELEKQVCLLAWWGMVSGLGGERPFWRAYIWKRNGRSQLARGVRLQDAEQVAWFIRGMI